MTALVRARRAQANDVCGECDGPIDLRTWTKKTNQFLLNISTTFQNVCVAARGLITGLVTRLGTRPGCQAGYLAEHWLRG